MFLVLISGVKLLLIHNWFKKCWWMASYIFYRTWNFQGYQINSIIKNTMDFSKGWPKKNNMEISVVCLVFGLRISKGSNTGDLRKIYALSFVLSEIPRGKVKKTKNPKVYPQYSYLDFLSTTLYRKPADCAALLHFYSNHSLKYKESIAFLQALRYNLLDLMLLQHLSLPENTH